MYRFTHGRRIIRSDCLIKKKRWIKGSHQISTEIDEELELIWRNITDKHIAIRKYGPPQRDR